MNDNTLLLRQIHPSFVQSGRVTSQAFTPTPKDDRQLSTYDGDLISAEAAFKHYTDNLSLKSIGVYAIQVAECLEENLLVKHDPEPYPEHVLVDFSSHNDKSIKTLGKKLREKAVRRGWLYVSANVQSPKDS